MLQLLKSKNTCILLAGIIIAISVATVIGIDINIKTTSAETIPSTGATGNNGGGGGAEVVVHTGGGNSTNVLVQFVPQQVQIKVGQSVSWDNPTPVGEPHTVTFAFDNKTMTNVVGPFAVSNSTQFLPLPPGSNNEPVMAPGKNNVIIAFNARSFIPTVIDSQGVAKKFSPNAAYTMTGSERYVNSGWLLPKGQEQGFPGSSTTFTVTFQKAGTYNYVCEVHPWMIGAVVVK